jgi:hypothetical protein
VSDPYLLPRKEEQRVSDPNLLHPNLLPDYSSDLGKKIAIMTIAKNI